MNELIVIKPDRDLSFEHSDGRWDSSTPTNNSLLGPRNLQI
jgi:hypothetical protein